MGLDNRRISKAVELFEKKPIWYSISYIIFLAVVVGIIQGLAVFISQLLMVNIIPSNEAFNNNAIYGVDEVNSLIDSSSIIRTVNTITAPFISIGGALSLAFGLGTSINYSRALGARKYEKAKAVFSSGFYTTVFFSIITSIIIMAIAYLVLPTQVGTIDTSSIDPEDIQVTSEQVGIYQEKVLTFSRSFVLLLIGVNIFQCLIQLLSTCLNSEGRNLVATFILLGSTFLNVLAVFLLLKYTSLGVLGSGISYFISWFSSFVAFIIYIYYLNRKNETLLLFSSLKTVKIEWWIFWLIIALGSTSFFRNISSAILGIINNNEIINVTSQVGHFEDENYFSNINGAVVPIHNLLLSAIVGIVRGGRTIISYLYSSKQFLKVKKIFSYVSIATVIIALLLYLFGVFVIGDWLLSWFGFDNSNQSIMEDAKKALQINTVALITFSFGISGTLFFQSIGDSIRSNFFSLFQGIIIGIPIIYINSAVSISVGGEQGMFLFYASQVIIFAISGIIIFSYSFWYVHKKMGNDKVKNNLFIVNLKMKLENVGLHYYREKKSKK